MHIGMVISSQTVIILTVVWIKKSRICKSAVYAIGAIVLEEGEESMIVLERGKLLKKDMQGL